MDTSWIDYYANLMLNMTAGLLPEQLTEKEIAVLVEKHGENWFEELGYTEPEYKKPITKKE